MFIRSLLSLGAVLVALASTVAAGAAFHLKEGDRVVFYGDSITDQRLYTTFTETFVVTRFPKLNVTFVHSGWGGDRVTGGGGGPIDVRLERDVLAYRPTVMTIMLGMNDASYRAFDQPIFDQYCTGYQRIIETVKSALPGIRITVIRPSPYDDVAQPPTFPGGYNAVLIRYGQFVQELAERAQLHVADLNAGVVAALEKAKASNPDLVKKIIPDRVHPGASGHLLMAGELLKSWNAPALVTDVEIDARGSKVITARGTAITGLQVDGTLSWTQRDEALPMPIDLADAPTALAVSSSDFVSALNQQPLKLSGLAANRYTLKIDGAVVGQFTKEQWADGVNLATLNTPMARQAADVHKLTLQHNQTHFSRWRQVQVPLASFKSPQVQGAVKALIGALDEEEQAQIKQQRAAAQPTEHRYELVPD